jgi:amino acid adenylation domain-containing protein
MNFEQTSKQTADKLIHWIRHYASLHIDSHSADEQRGFPPHVLLELGNQGFFGIHISRKYGGLELETSEMLRVIEQVAAIDLTLSVILIESIQGAHTLEHYASEQMKNKYLNQMATGRVFTAGAMTESDAGSNPRAMKSVAISQGEGEWLISGSKRWIGMGSSAAITAVYVQQFNKDNHWEGMSGFLVPQGAKGLHVGLEDFSMGIRGFSKNKLTLDKVKVNSEQLLGCVGGGMEIAQANMMYIRLCLAAATIGAMKRCVQLMHRYAERRIIATGSLLENPVTLVRLSEITAIINAQETLVYSISSIYDQDSSLVPEEAFIVSKILGSEFLGWVVDQALQLLGARGYEETCDISKIFRDARVFRIFEGPTEALNMYIGSRILTNNLSLERFISITMEQKQLYDDIKRATELVKENMQVNKTTLFAKPFTAHYWTQALVGDIVSYGLLLSCLKYAAQKNKSETLDRPILWAQNKYHDVVQKALTYSLGEKVLIQSQQLGELISSYAFSIGNIDQTRRNNNISIDPLLQAHTTIPLNEPTPHLGHELFPRKSAYGNERPRHLLTVDEQERFQLLHEWNRIENATHYPNLYVHNLFEEQALKNPQAIAVVFNGTELSYQELNERANQVAHYLIQEGIGSNTLVALYSLEMIVGLLGVLKSGAAYLPLDYNYPEKSLQFMLEDSSAALVLSQEPLLDDFPFDIQKTVAIEHILKTSSSEAKKDILRKVILDNLGYVIYTSGSTGQPKGVMLPHRALSNLMFWHRDQIKEQRNVLQFTTLNFDMSFIEIFSALSSGGTLTLIADQDRLDLTKFAQIIKNNAVEQLVLSVPFLKNLVDAALEPIYFEQVKEIIIAGEQLVVTEAVLSFFKQLSSCTLFNYYGPSETHVVSAYKFPKNTSDWPDYPPIGSVISNSKIVILDENKQLLPIGTIGEIYIGGACLATGYLHRAELTQEKFVADPLSKEANSLLYRSGDCGKYLPDGTIIYTGRKDEQLKIRGYRIEPKEIEWHLEKHAGIKEAVVIAKKSHYKDKHLEAFIVVNDAINDNFINELYAYLQDRLPPQMLPSVFNIVEKVPLTNSGKVDRIALEKYDRALIYSVSHFTEPSTETEKEMINIMEEIFKIRIGVNQSFISIGGNSLLAMQIISKLRDKYSIDLPAHSILSDPTIADTAKRIDLLCV